MSPSKQGSWFTLAVLALVVLILAEIGVLGYKFWFKPPGGSQEESSVVVPSLLPCPSPSITTKPFVQLFFGWLEKITVEEVTLRTEESQLITFSLSNQTEFFSLNPQKTKEGSLSLLIFFDPNFQARLEIGSLTREEINPGSPAYLIVERTADDAFLGRRLVVIEE